MWQRKVKIVLTSVCKRKMDKINTLKTVFVFVFVNNFFPNESTETNITESFYSDRMYWIAKLVSGRAFLNELFYSELLQ